MGLPSLSATLYADSMAPCGLSPLRMLLWQLRPSPSYHRTCGSRRSLLTTQMLRRCYRNKLTTSSVTCTSCTLTTNRGARDHSQNINKKNTTTLIKIINISVINNKINLKKVINLLPDLIFLISINVIENNLRIRARNKGSIPSSEIKKDNVIK